MQESQRYGASSTDWDMLVDGDLTQDLLPTVSNPNIPISPRSKIQKLGKVPSIMTHKGEASGFSNWTEYNATLNDIKAWRTNPNYGICIQTRRLRAIDIDIEDEAAVQDALDVIGEHMMLLTGIEPPIRSRPNSNRVLLTFYCDEPLKYHCVKTKQGAIEILGDGRQFIAYGHHSSGAFYEWDSPPMAAPTITAAQVVSIVNALAKALKGEVPQFSESKVVKQLEFEKPLDTSRLYNHLSDNGLILGEHARGLLIKCPFDGEHTTGEPGDGSTIYCPEGVDLIGEVHEEAIICLHSHCKGRPLMSYEDKLGLRGKPTDGFENLDEKDDVPPVDIEFNLIPDNIFGVLDDKTRTTWLVDDVIATKSLVMIYGPPASGKSFVALDLAYDLAEGGRAFADRHATQVKQPVLYVAGEGFSGMRKRINGIRKHRELGIGDSAETLLRFYGGGSSKIDLMDEKWVIAFIKGVKASDTKFKLIAFDTLSACTNGLDENTGRDGTTIVKHCQEIIRTTGATVMLVHHSGKDAEKGARGWSGYRGAVDTEITIRYYADNDARMFEVTKQKDGELSRQEYPYDLVEVQLDLTRTKAKTDGNGYAVLDDSGSPILEEVQETTNVVSWRDAKLPPKKPETQKARKGKLERKISEFIMEHVDDGVTGADIEDEFYHNYKGEDSDIPSLDLIRDAMKSLCKSNDPHLPPVVTMREVDGYDRYFYEVKMAHPSATEGFLSTPQ